MDFSRMGEMLSQASALREQMDAKLTAMQLEGTSGGGAVVARMDGNKRLLKLTIAPAAVASSAGDVSMLEDLVVAAVNDAARRADEAQQASAAGMLGGMGLPDGLPGLGE